MMAAVSAGLVAISGSGWMQLVVVAGGAYCGHGYVGRSRDPLPWLRPHFPTVAVSALSCCYRSLSS